MRCTSFRTNILVLHASLIFITLSAMPGCSSSATHLHPGYETIGKDLRRDTDLAKRKNAEAIEQIHQNKYPDAEKLLKESLEADVTLGPAHNNLGKVYYHDNELYLAAWEFQYAAKLMPDLPEPRNNLGLVLESVGKLDEAVNSYDEAIKLRPDNAQFLGNDARARYQRGDHDERLRKLLQDLVMRDTRPDWSEWVRERLALMEPHPATAP